MSNWTQDNGALQWLRKSANDAVRGLHAMPQDQVILTTSINSSTGETDRIDFALFDRNVHTHRVIQGAMSMIDMTDEKALSGVGVRMFDFTKDEWKDTYMIRTGWLEEQLGKHWSNAVLI